MSSDNNISLLIFVGAGSPLPVSALSNFFIKIVHDKSEVRDSLLNGQFDALVIAQPGLVDALDSLITPIQLIWPWIPIITVGDNTIGDIPSISPTSDAIEMEYAINRHLYHPEDQVLGAAFFAKFTGLTQRLGKLLFNDGQKCLEKLLAQEVAEALPQFFVGFLDQMEQNLQELSTYNSSKSFNDFLHTELTERFSFLGVDSSKLAFEYSKESMDADGMTFDQSRLITVPVIEDDNISGVVVIYIDENANFTDDEVLCTLKHLEQTLHGIHRVRDLRSRDSLTGLYNHSYLKKALVRTRDFSVKHNEPMTVAMLDIDYFKNLNDSYGHHIGDLLIIELGKLVSSVTKRYDIVARCGGDEMIILLPNTDNAGARSFAERLLETVRNFEFTAAGCPLHFTVSLGVVSTDLHNVEEGTDLIELADKAMYLAKKSGRNQYCVASDVISVAEEEPVDFSEYNSRTLAQYQNSQLGKGKILVVDDDLPIVSLLTRILEVSGYEVEYTTSSTKAMDIIRSKPDLFDVILTDINMPRMDGIQLLKSIRDTDPNIVGIIITGFASTQNTINALRAGAYNLIQKPFDMDEINLIVERAVERRRLKRQLDAYHVNLEEVLQDKTKALHSALDDLKGSYIKTMEAIIHILDVHETTMANHSQRVSQLSVFLARKMGVTDKGTLNTVRFGALLHDIGKIGIPDSILTKPGPLTDDEWETMKEHPDIGYSIVSTIPVLEKAAEMVRSHHEKFDGSGYPLGLAGEKICIEARIFSVIDAYDALRNHRCYQDEQSLDAVVNEINNCSGSHFDPQVVNAFNNCYQELDNLPLAADDFWEQF